MRAALLTEYGDVDKLEIRDVPEPEPRPGEVKVRVAASSINPIDYWTRSGRLQNEFPLVLPAILGRDVSGEVVRVGRGVTLARAAAERSLVIPIARRVPFAQIREAHSIAETGAEGKVVLRMY